MAININDAWKVNKNGTLRTTPSYNISTLGANFTNLDVDKRHGIYNNVPLEMWWAHYDWGETTPQSTIDYCRSVVSRANEMFDYSYCWAGLGYESFISRTQYVCYYNLVNGKGDKPVIYQDASTNTPWTFDYNTHENRSNYFYQNGMNWNYSNFRNNKGQYGYQECWKNNTNTSNPNNNTQYWGSSTAYAFVNWTPLHIIAPKNWVNLIVVIAKKSLTSLDFGNNVGAWDLYTYAKTSVHEEYPYVIGTFIVPYMEYGGSDVPSGKRSPLRTGDSANAQYMFRLTNYVKPSIAGQYIFTSSDDVPNYFHESPWHSGIISRSPMQGSFVTWSGIFNGGLRYLRDTSPTSNPLSTLCAIQIGGAIRPMSESRLLNENGIYSYADTLYLSVELGNSKWQREFGEYTYTDSGTTYTKKGVCYYREFDSTFYEECMQQTACFGLLFTDRHSVAYEGDIDDRNMFLGVLDDNNIGHGEYTRGYENLDQKQLNWTNTEDADYSPSYNPPVPRTDPNTYNNNTGFNHPSAPQAFYDYYLLNGTQVENVKNELWNFDADFDPTEDLTFEEYLRDKFLTNNPIDLIVSLRKYPESHVVPPSPTDHVVIGKYTTSVMGYKLGSVSEEINLGSVAIFERFGGNFLDYECTQLFLYVPFCGICELDTSIYMGHTVKVKMFIDYTTGACTAYIICETPLGDLVTNTLDGKAAVDLAVSGLQTATLEQSLTAQKTSVKGNAGVAAAKAVVGAVETGVGAALAASGAGTPVGLGVAARGVSNVVSGLEGIRDALTDNYKLNHPVVSPQQIGASTALNSWTGELVPRLIIYRPVTNMYSGVGNDPAVLNVQQSEIYGHSQGFTDIRLGSIISNNLTGFVQMTNVDLSGISATATEKTEIINLLASGIYC